MVIFSRKNFNVTRMLCVVFFWTFVNQASEEKLQEISGVVFPMKRFEMLCVVLFWTSVKQDE